MTAMRIAIAWALAALWGVLSLAGCASRPAAPVVPGIRAEGISSRLARVGLELITEEEAQIPRQERGRSLAVRVIPGFPEPALPPHPAGYLIVGLNRELVRDSAPLEEALRAWSPGRPLRLTVRRNPYLQVEPGWWEAEVELRLPR